MPGAVYNEINPFAAEWMRNLIRDGAIAPGDVDERSMLDVTPDDYRGYTQVHLCAGIGGWSLALRMAGWEDDRPCWTASFPCQPFSAAGKGDGFADERHLWPYGLHLIRVSRPGVLFGEQVASKDGLAWLDLVQADLQGEDYACWARDTCVAGLGGPHLRQRLWFVADRLHDGLQGSEPAIATDLRRRLADESGARVPGSLAIANDPERGPDGSAGDDSRGPDAGRTQGPGDPEGCSKSNSDGVVLDDTMCGRYGEPDEALRSGRRPTVVSGAAVGQADSQIVGWGEERPHSGGELEGDRAQGLTPGPEHGRDLGGVALGDPLGQGSQVGSLGPEFRGPIRVQGSAIGATGALHGPWSGAEWVWCSDGRWRPVEPGFAPLAHGLPRSMAGLSPEARRLAEMAGLHGKSLARAKSHRIGTLQGYGNAICTEVAAEFVRAYMAARP